MPREPDHPVCTADAALIVRKLGGRYQIVSGHNRKKAAANAGLSEVPCWVRVMTDDEARDELSRCNNQGELDPLEYGREAAKRRLEKGDNTPGGLSEYAKSIKRLRQTVTNWADAATVTNWADAADVARTSDCMQIIGMLPTGDARALSRRILGPQRLARPRPCRHRGRRNILRHRSRLRQGWPFPRIPHQDARTRTIAVLWSLLPTDGGGVPQNAPFTV